jgi:hypothetical protein
VLGPHHLVEQEMEAVLTLEEVFAGLVVDSFWVEEKRSRVLAGKCHTRNFPVAASEATVFVLLEDLKVFGFVQEEEAEVCCNHELVVVLGCVWGVRSRSSRNGEEGSRVSHVSEVAASVKLL